MKTHWPSLLLAVGSVALAARSQVPAGQSICTVLSPSDGALFTIDHEARRATRLTISSVLAAERVECITMFTPALGVVGTVGQSGSQSGNVFQIGIVGTTVTEQKLNATPLAGRYVGQIARVGSRLYFTTPRSNGIGAVLQSVPLSGGPVAFEYDFGTGAAYAVAALGGVVHVATFHGYPNETLFAYDTRTRSAWSVAQLPASKLAHRFPESLRCVGLMADPRQSGALAILGLHGDLVSVDAATGSVLRHDFTGFNVQGVGTSNIVWSMDWDPRTRDFVVGADGPFVDRIVDGQAAKQIVTLGNVPYPSSVTGIAHVPARRGVDEPAGAGCVGNAGYTLTSADAGLPVVGNAAFRFAVYCGASGDPVLLLLGSGPAAIDLGAWGAPGCVLRTSADVAVIGTTLNGWSYGTGHGSLAMPIPAAAAGLTLWHQWVELQGMPTNPLGLVVSNARRLHVQ